MDTIAEFCTRIRNAVMAQHTKVDIPASKIRVGIAEKLKSAGYIKNYVVVQDGRQGIMRLYLKYNLKGQSALTHIERVSKPSCRQYVQAEKIPPVLSHYGLLIMSTNKGILSGKEAKKQNVGGEILCRIY